MDESSFKHFIEHLVGTRENSKFLAQVRLKPKQDQLAMLRTNHNERSNIYAKSNIAKQLNWRTNKVANKRKKHQIEEKEEETYHWIPDRIKSSTIYTIANPNLVFPLKGFIEAMLNRNSP